VFHYRLRLKVYNVVYTVSATQKEKLFSDLNIATFVFNKKSIDNFVHEIFSTFIRNCYIRLGKKSIHYGETGSLEIQ
jgi:hypothetical protein